VRSQISTLFADEPDLIAQFDDSVKQQKLKASEKYSFEGQVKLRFADQPNKLAEFNSLFLNVCKQMLEDPSPQKLPQVWKEMHSQMATVLEGEPDLMEEFEVFYAKIQALGT
jgi:histone deacetylase complex regulatory component SIN3